MNKKNLIPAKKGEVRNPSGNNQYTKERKILEMARGLLANIPSLQELDAINRKELVDAMKIVEEFVMNSDVETIVEVGKDPQCSMWARGTIRDYMSKDGHKSMRKDIGLDSEEGNGGVNIIIKDSRIGENLMKI